MNNKNDNTALPFIIVSDKVIAEHFKAIGMICVNETNGFYTFINDNKLLFASDIGEADSKLITYVNKLTF